jgi:signal peptidase I
MAHETATANVDNTQQGTAKRPEQARNGIAEWAVTILLLLFGTTTLVQAFVIPTGSMEDTLLIGDHLLVDKLAYAPVGPVSKFLLPYEEPKHGDVIVFRYPAQIQQTFVKRVIGVPGDRIKMVSQVIYRNGSPIFEPYVYHKVPVFGGHESFPSDAYSARNMSNDAPDMPKRAELQADMLEHHVVNGEVVVPPNCYFAMGDNRDNSLDSRYWGFVPRDNIIGKPLLIYWSYRATTEDLAGSSVGSLISHFGDLAVHFFSRTRWDRTLRLVRGFPDNKLSSQPLPTNQGDPNP